MATKSIRLSDGTDTLLPESAVSGSKYQKCADGTLIIWGSDSLQIPPSQEVSVSLTFAIPFVGSTPIVVANSLTARPQQLCVAPSSVSLTGFTLAGWNAVSTTTTYTTYYAWIAIGRWK